MFVLSLLQDDCRWQFAIHKLYRSLYFWTVTNQSVRDLFSLVCITANNEIPTTILNLLYINEKVDSNLAAFKSKLSIKKTSNESGTNHNGVADLHARFFERHQLGFGTWEERKNLELFLKKSHKASSSRRQFLYHKHVNFDIIIS